MASFNLTTEKEDVFHERVNYDYPFLKSNYTRLGIPDPESVLKAPVEGFDAALTKAQNTDRTKSDILLKNQTQKTLKEKLGAWGKEYIFSNHNLTAEDIIAFDLHQRKPSSTIYPPDYPPIMLVNTAVSRQLSFGYYVLPGPHQRMAKPDGVKACVLRWLMSETEPTDISQLVNIEYGTDGPIVLHFNESDRGKKVWFVASWQIERGRLESPMTAIMCVIIP
jgi:hypothetical protein